MAKKKNLKKRLKENYKKSWKYVKDSKNYIYVSILIFMIFSILGFFLPPFANLDSIINDFIENILLKTQGMGFFEITVFIFLNNIQSSFLGILYGIVLGIFPILAAMMNGYLLGYVASESVSAGGIFVLWGILPHGVFELPALFISLGMGIKLGSFIFKKNKTDTLKEYSLESLRTFLLIVLPLLIVAAIIEGVLISLVS